MKGIIQLNGAVTVFWEKFTMPERFNRFNNEVWIMLYGYVMTLEELIVQGSKMLEGEHYPAMVAVIPLIDQIVHFLVELLRKEKREITKH